MARALDPGATLRIEPVGRVGHDRLEPPAEPLERRADRGKRAGGLRGQIHHRAIEARRLGFDAVSRFLSAAFVARIGRRPNAAQQGFDGPVRSSFDQPLEPAVGWQSLRGGKRRLDRLATGFIVTGDIGQPRRQSPAAAARLFLGAHDPAAQLDRLGPGQRGGEGAVGRLEHVVPFVEYDARRALCVIAAAGCVHHHERVVGDDEIGLRRGARCMLDEALPVMRAPGIDALAALVGQGGDAALADQRAEPAGQVAADHVAVLAECGPPRDELGQDRRTASEPSLKRILQVEQAEIVLAPLADYDRPRTVTPSWRPRPAALAPQLALQVLCESGDPDRPAGPLGPQVRGRQVAQRLADSRAGLRQQHVRHAALGAWRKHAAGLARITALPLAALGPFAGQAGQARLDLFLLDQHVRGLGAFGRFLPFGQAREQPALGPLGLADVRQQDLCPRPAQTHQRLQRRPRALALGPVVAFAHPDQAPRRRLQE